MLGVLLHLLQVLLLTLETPGVVFEHGVTVAAFQSVVEHLSLPQPFQLHILLQLVKTGWWRDTKRKKLYLVVEYKTTWQ